MSVRVSVDYSICTRSVAVAKKADRTAYDVWYNCTRIEPKRLKCHAWNNHGRVPTAILESEISAVRLSHCGWTIILYSNYG